MARIMCNMDQISCCLIWLCKTKFLRLHFTNHSRKDILAEVTVQEDYNPTNPAGVKEANMPAARLTLLVILEIFGKDY